jgi:hypothetical protein
MAPAHTAYKPRAAAQLEGFARGTETTVKFGAESLAAGHDSLEAL